ncbi:hypothetical protein BMS3Abin03_00673 [bacterium BMS3Abin03]|nr:hypothetical protein BMS3Abin03_00673 [bacterium BMS3Abin03]
MNINSTFSSGDSRNKQEEIFLLELRNQNWLSVLISMVLGEEIFLSLQ